MDRRKEKTNIVTIIPFFIRLRKVYMENGVLCRLCRDEKCEGGWGKLEVFFWFVIGSLTMLRTCRRSNELENAWRKREAAI